MNWYSFRQNNSFGMYDGAKHVYIQARDDDEANRIAESHENSPIYFDGCRAGKDCSCCGDRWTRAYSDDGDDLAELIEAECGHKFAFTLKSDDIIVIPHWKRLENLQ